MADNDRGQGLDLVAGGNNDPINSKSRPTAAGGDTTMSDETRLDLETATAGRGAKEGGSWDTIETASPTGLFPADNAAQSDEAPDSRTNPPRDAAYYGNMDALNKDTDLNEHPVDFSSDEAIREEAAHLDELTKTRKPATAGIGDDADTDSSSGLEDNGQDFIAGGPSDDKRAQP